MALSVTYNFVRARQLEGTFPGDASEGIWPITAQRVFRGWGAPEEQDWPCVTGVDQWPPPEPSGVDLKAKPNRSHHYQRVRSAIDCSLVLSRGGTFKAAFEITEQWFDAPDGIIEMPEDEAPIVGSHAVRFVPRYLENRGFVFANSWGEEWGNHGFGALSPEFFDRYLIEAWVPFGVGLFFPYFEGRGVKHLVWGMPDCLGEVLHGREIFDATHDERIAWTFAVCRDRFLDVEEFFVKPVHRRQGHGTRLVAMLRELADVLRLNIRLWVPFADCEPENLPGMERVVSKLGLELAPSGVRWAALKAVPPRQSSQVILPWRRGASQVRAADLLSKISMPKRTAQVRPVASALGAAAVAATLAVSACDNQPPTDAAGAQVARSEPVSSDQVSDDELERGARKALERYAPLYQRLASEPSGTTSEQPHEPIPDDVFQASAIKAFQKYSELYERLS